MKLIDLLVKELPKRGGWPDGAEYCHLTQYDRHCLTIVFSHKQVGTGNNPITSKEGMVFSGIGYLGDTLYGCIVTAKEYKSALAASQNPAWSGECLPPVGCECEAKYRESDSAEWFLFRCVSVDCGVAFGWAGKEAVTLGKGNYEFRPLRTEAERKRDAAIEAMQREGDDANNWIYSEYEIIYDAIAAGKIPGVKLDD